MARPRFSVVDRAGQPDYKPPLPGPRWAGSAQVAQLVEHATENRSVGGSIPPLGTITSTHPMSVVRGGGRSPRMGIGIQFPIDTCRRFRLYPRDLFSIPFEGGGIQAIGLFSLIYH